MDDKKKSGIYLHIPFCRQKCLYCDFFSAGQSLLDSSSYADALIGESETRFAELPSAPSTIYIGGGTPSLLPPSSITKILSAIRNRFPDAIFEEITLEVNPEDVTPDKAEAWREAGVNRVSMGIQSLEDSELRACGRRHSASQAVEAMKILRTFFTNISADVIFGLPRQTQESWKHTIEGIIALKPTHISGYSLMLEQGTAMTILSEQGRIILPEESESALMFEMLTDELRKAGFRRYEISNYALPGYESIHNSRYWSGDAYLGIGPAAHSYDGVRTRRRNRKDIKSYLEKFAPEHAAEPTENNRAPFYEEEILSDEELREEYILTRMRTAAGIQTADYSEKFGKRATDTLMANAQRDIKSGRIIEESGTIRLSDSGIMTADDVIVNLL